MIIPMLCVTIFVILVVWFLLPRVARLMIHTPTAISIFGLLMVGTVLYLFLSIGFNFLSELILVTFNHILVVGLVMRIHLHAFHIQVMVMSILLDLSI